MSGQCWTASSFRNLKNILQSIEKSPAMYQCAVGHLVFQGLAFQPAQHFMMHLQRISSTSLSQEWTPPTLICKGTSNMCLTIKLSPFVLKNTTLKLIIPQCPCLFSFMFSFWHSKTKSVNVNPELQQDMDLTRGKYLPLAKANKTKVQRASQPVCINVTASGRGRLRTFMKS